MAINPIRFLVAPNVSVASGLTTVNVIGNVDCSRVFSGSAIFIGGAPTPVEGFRGTAPNALGISTITLRNNWPYQTLSNAPMVVFNTNEGLGDAIINVRNLVSNMSAIENLAGEGLIRKLGENVYEIVDASDVGLQLLGASTTALQREALGLQDAALKNVSQTPTDASTDRLILTQHAYAQDSINWHRGILEYLQNTSGESVASNATLAGSNLTPTQQGSWRNVSGNSIANNSHGLFRRIA